MKFFLILFFGFGFFVMSCAAPPPAQKNIEPAETAQEEDPKLVLTQASYDQLPGWQGEDYKYFATAFVKSCDVLQRRQNQFFKEGPEWGRVEDWKRLCKEFPAYTEDQYRLFFETHFIPHQISANTEKQGLFTGYYEASLKGSRRQYGSYQIPLHARPDDLVMVQLGEFRDELKGTRIAGRVIDGRLKPYETREEIISGKLPDDQEEILVWVDNPVDAFFVQIQGSGLVRLDDGTLMRIGYAGQNGHVYYAIGRELIKRGALDQDNVSMQSIRAWLSQNPDQATEVMNTNKSYVFFRELTGEGPVGGQGVALTATRSLAIDHSLIPYGMPLWIDIEYPEDGYSNIQRLMVAQDTGGAIRGPVRGDFFWGYGDFAEKKAGIMKSKGQYWVFLPKPSAN